ncbi:MAG TPA: ABC transporter permease subunit, partial [Megamonas hypermegale]|nr:ABC transporter permease subunit [Megamonas hypermegale]
IDRDLIAAARTLGMSEEKIFWKIVIPLAKPGIMAGAVLSFARALGEFGATIMLAGNIPGKTQTMSTAIYAAVQANDQESAFLWAVIIIIFSLLVMMFMNYWLKKQKSMIE